MFVVRTVVFLFQIGRGHLAGTFHETAERAPVDLVKVLLHEPVEAAPVDLVEVLLHEPVQSTAIDLVEVPLLAPERHATANKTQSYHVQYNNTYLNSTIITLYY